MPDSQSIADRLVGDFRSTAERRWGQVSTEALGSGLNSEQLLVRERCWVVVRVGVGVLV